MEGFKQALNKWIQVGSGEWISQALLKALKNDEDLWKHFSEDFSKLERVSQEALLKLTQQVSTSAPFAWRKTTEYKFWEARYNLVDHVDYNNETQKWEVITLEGYQIDEALSKLISKMSSDQDGFDHEMYKNSVVTHGLSTEEYESSKQVEEAEEVSEEYVPNLDDVDMENLPTGENLRKLMSAIIESSEYTSIEEAFKGEFRVMKNIGDFADVNGNKYKIRAFALSDVAVNGDKTLAAKIFTKYLLQEWMLTEM